MPGQALPAPSSQLSSALGARAAYINNNSFVLASCQKVFVFCARTAGDERFVANFGCKRVAVACAGAVAWSTFCDPLSVEVKCDA